MAQLKGVIFGIRDVLVKKGSSDSKVLEQIGRLVSFLDSHGIGSVAIGNSDWFVTDKSTGKRFDLKEVLESEWGVKFRWFIYGVDGFPPKQSSAALERIREEMGWEPNEMLYIGNSDEDMQSAINGGTLFLNALWYGDNNPYGFRFDSPKAIARFIDIFCLREHWWYFAIDDGPLQIYALAPFSTYAREEYKAYSEDFIQTVKQKLGDEEDVDFWAKYLCTSMYFSGLYAKVNYIVPYPGHKKGSEGPSILAAPMTAFAKCFRGNFIKNLILRHKTAIESKRNRDTIDHHNQLNTICLERKPERSPGKTYASSPIKAGRTVMVLDDILTNGYSFEAARTFLAATGAETICVGILKSMNRDYLAIEQVELAATAYDAHEFKGVNTVKTYRYRDHIVDPDAATELSSKLDKYATWDWPDE